MRLLLTAAIIVAVAVQPSAYAQQSTAARQWMADLMRYERVVGRALRDGDLDVLGAERNTMSHFLGKMDVVKDDAWACVAAASALWNVVLDATATKPVSPTAIRRNRETFVDMMPRCEKKFGVSQERQL